MMLNKTVGCMVFTYFFWSSFSFDFVAVAVAVLYPSIF